MYNPFKELIKILSINTNPVVIKAMCDFAFNIEPHCRMPLLQLDTAQQSSVLKALDAHNIPIKQKD